MALTGSRTSPADYSSEVLDLCRVLCASSSALASYSSNTGQGLVELLLQACAFDADWPTGGSKTRDINTMLAIRALANLTKTEAGRKSLTGDRLTEVGSFSLLAMPSDDLLGPVLASRTSGWTSRFHHLQQEHTSSIRYLGLEVGANVNSRPRITDHAVTTAFPY
jgi:hypothetical protein